MITKKCRIQGSIIQILLVKCFYPPLAVRLVQWCFLNNLYTLTEHSSACVGQGICRKCIQLHLHSSSLSCFVTNPINVSIINDVTQVWSPFVRQKLKSYLLHRSWHYLSAYPLPSLCDIIAAVCPQQVWYSHGIVRFRIFLRPLLNSIEGWGWVLCIKQLTTHYQ